MGALLSTLVSKIATYFVGIPISIANIEFLIKPTWGIKVSGIHVQDPRNRTTIKVPYLAVEISFPKKNNKDVEKPKIEQPQQPTASLAGASALIGKTNLSLITTEQVPETAKVYLGIRLSEPLLRTEFDDYTFMKSNWTAILAVIQEKSGKKASDEPPKIQEPPQDTTNQPVKVINVQIEGNTTIQLYSVPLERELVPDVKLPDIQVNPTDFESPEKIAMLGIKLCGEALKSSINLISGLPADVTESLTGFTSKLGSWFGSGSPIGTGGNQTENPVDTALERISKFRAS